MVRKASHIKIFKCRSSTEQSELNKARIGFRCYL